tara:strand:- start:1 stop:555 length:555 start_codon:yes stop_codon:yes gene_type:complete
MLILEPQFQYFSPFLRENYYDELEKHVYSYEIDWHWLNHTLNKAHEGYDKDTFVLGKLVYYKGEKKDLSTVDEIWHELIESIEDQFNCYIYRIRLNLYTNQNQRIFTLPHYDITERGAYVPDRKADIIIMNFTTCNGGTKIEQFEINSHKNSAVHFSNVHSHCGIVQTNAERRICANIVIYRKE